MNILERFRQMELFAASFRKEGDGRSGERASKRTRKRSPSQRAAARRRTVRLTVSAFAAALTVTAMFLGVVFGVLDLTALIFGSFLIAFCLIEMGGAYPYLVWLVASAIAFFVVPDKLVCFEYLLFAGVYPILKFRVARLPAVIGWVIKLALFNAALTACAALSTWVLGIDAENGISFGWIVYLAGNAMFLIYDLALSSVSAFYILRLRRAIKADSI